MTAIPEAVRSVGRALRGHLRLHWLATLLVGFGIAATIGGGYGIWYAVAYTTADVDTIGKIHFDRALQIPPLAPSHEVDGRRVFDLNAQAGRTDLGRPEPTSTMGYNQSYLGPTLRATRGENVEVDVTNSLPESTTVHWHGMHLPAAMDGGPHQLIPSGRTWKPTWKIDQPSATLWYHPHPDGRSAAQLYQGLAGMFIVDDPADAQVEQQLPHNYGIDDIPVIVQDKKFDGSQLDSSTPAMSNIGVVGDTILVNGTPDPYLDVTSQRVRLRLLDASNARTFRFAFSDSRPFDVVASDGGLLTSPVPVKQLWLSPGERAEVVVDMSPGQRVVLRGEPTGQAGGGRFEGGDDRFDILQLRAASHLTPSPDLPGHLADPPDLNPADVVKTRDFGLARAAINGERMDMSVINFAVTVDTTERWRVQNLNDGPHNFHVHDAQFVIEAINGHPPPPEEAGWKDTVWLPNDTEADLLIKFTDYTDARLPYMYHCHIMQHEDQGMMGQFVVVPP